MSSISSKPSSFFLPKSSVVLSPRSSSPMSTYYSKPDRRPKKKTYHRVPDLHKAMDLYKEPSLLPRLKTLISSHSTRPLLLGDLEKEVGFVQKWNFLSLIQKHHSICRISAGGASSRSPISLSLTAKDETIAKEEPFFMESMEPVLVNNLRKLLMLSIDCRVPVEKVELVESEMGLPLNWKKCFVSKYPDFFSVKNVDGTEFLCLESWDSSLAVTAREEKLDLGSFSRVISKDGNFSRQFAFRIKFAPGFRPNVHYLQELQKWQRLAFPSPYLNARRVDPGTPEARKRGVAVLHEILSLMMEKRLTLDKLDAFHREYQLPCRLLLCLVKNHGIFYITNKGARSTVFLKEAYDGSELIDKCPLLRFQDRFMSLIGRTSLI